MKSIASRKRFLFAPRRRGILYIICPSFVSGLGKPKALEDLAQGTTPNNFSLGGLAFALKDDSLYTKARPTWGGRPHFFLAFETALPQLLFSIRIEQYGLGGKLGVVEQPVNKKPQKVP